MVRLEGQKHATKDSAIEGLPLPSRVSIPLSQHLGKMCLSHVEAGDEVLTGQKIAGVEARVSAPIHASVSGKVVAIEDWPHPIAGRCMAVVIASDGFDKKQDTKRMTQGELSRLTADQIRAVVFEAGIVGMGGAGFPTHVKLEPPKPVDTLLVNGAECEPCLTGDYRLMVEKTKEIIAGIALVAKCLGVKKVFFAVEDNKPQAIKAFDAAVRPMPFVLRVLKSAYPQGGEKQLIKTLLNREVPQGKLPFDIGVVVHNVGTMYAIYEAVYLNKPLYERVVTVSGSCLTHPRNLLVRIGTPIKELIDFCGPLKERPAKIIVGGPMMGVAQFSDSVPVIKSTTGVLVFNEDEARAAEEEFCIRCGACIRECPAGLMPCMINLASEKKFWDKAASYGASDCIECGLCNYVCPAGRRLLQTITRAKAELAR